MVGVANHSDSEKGVLTIPTNYRVISLLLTTAKICTRENGRIIKHLRPTPPIPDHTQSSIKEKGPRQQRLLDECR